MCTYYGDCGINILEDGGDRLEVLSQHVNLALDEDRSPGVDFSRGGEGRLKDISSGGVEGRSNAGCTALNSSNGSLGNVGINTGLTLDHSDTGLWPN